MSEADKDWDEAPKLPKPAKPSGGTNWWRVLALLLLPYAVFSWYSDPFELEYYGYCKKDGVTRDPQALMNKYIEAIIKEQAEAGDNYVKYSSVQDFYQQNPQCCRMYAWQSLQLYPWWLQRSERLSARLFGHETFYQISLSYRWRINGSEPYMTSYPVISSCAVPVDGTGGSTREGYYPSGSGSFKFVSGHLD
jgi:hypothetical protein